jgi:hypothetical protein
MCYKDVTNATSYLYSVRAREFPCAISMKNKPLCMIVYVL